jgi:hypothetical protein
MHHGFFRLRLEVVALQQHPRRFAADLRDAVWINRAEDQTAIGRIPQ